MAKSICCVCGKPLGFFSDKISLKDGALCTKCLKMGGISSVDSASELFADRVSNAIRKKKDAVRSFSCDRNDGTIEIDTRTCLFKIEDNYFFFDELISYKYNEFPNNANGQRNDGTSGGAAIGGVIGGLGGGLLGGAIGAAVGGKIGSLFSGSCEYMNISLVLSNPLKSSLSLEFISQKTSVSSTEYAKAYKNANACLETLQIIKEYIKVNQRNNRSPNSQTERIHEEKSVFVQEGHFSASQLEKELMHYKHMWHSDLITKEEYEQKKKQLLSLK